MAVDLEQINLKFNASIGNVSKSFEALEKRLTRVNSALSSLNTSSLDRFAAQAERFSNAMSRMQSTDTANKAIRSTANALRKLAQIDTGSLSRVNGQIAVFAATMRGFNIDPSKATTLRDFANAMNSFARVRTLGGSQNLPALAANIKPLIASVQQLDFTRLQSIATALQSFANALNILGRAKVGTAITNLPLLAKEMENLMQSLARAPTVSNNVIRMTEALARLASNGSRVGTATNGLNRALNNAASAGGRGAKGLNLFGNSAKGARSHVKSLASVIGGLIAKYWIFFRAIQGMANMAGVASSMVEVQNVVDHTFGQMSYKLDEFAQKSIDTFGLSTLQVKQYASRFQSMGMAMGITNNQVAKTADFISSNMSKEAAAIYNTSESLADMSINLTKLAGDYASFYDVDPAETFEKFQSVMTGQTRPLRAYGLDLTQATLQEWALKNGIDADMQSMTQAQKAMLRYQYVMAQSEHITGDFARTSMTYHNVLTRLKANFMTLKGTIGTSLMNLFKPVLVVVNNAIVVINKFAKAVGDSLGKILGWRYEVGSGAIAMEDAADYADDVAGGLGNARKAAKELKKQLQGFDELNNLSLDDDNGGGGSGGGGSSGLGAGGADNLAGQWVKEESLFESDWDTWFKLGRGISEAWTEGLNSIDWDKVYSAFDDFGTGLAEFLNGLITPDLFGAVGKTIAGSLNSAFHFLDSFGTTFDWKNFGNSISTGVNKFFETFDFKLAGKSISNIATGLLDSMITAVQGIKWEEIGKSISHFIGSIDWAKLALNLSTLAIEIVNALAKAIDGVDFGAIGKAIGDMIKNIDFAKLGISLAKLAGSILKALAEALAALTESNPIAGVIAGFFVFDKIVGLGQKISTLGSGIGDKLASSIMSESTKGKIASTLSGAFSVTGTIFTAISTAILGWNLGNLIYESFTKDENGDNWIDRLISDMGDKLYELERNLLTWLYDTVVKINDFFSTSDSEREYAQLLETTTDPNASQAEKAEAHKKLAEWEQRDQNNEVWGGVFGEAKLKLGVEFEEGTTEKITQTHQEYTALWTDDNADFKVDPNATSAEEINTSYTEKSGIWKGIISQFTINPNATSTEEVNTSYQERGSIWKGIISKFTVNPNATKTDDITSAHEERTSVWTGKTANLSLNSTRTKIPIIQKNRDTRLNNWYGKESNMTFNPIKTTVKSIQDARDARLNNWYGKTSDFKVNTGATNINAVKTANSAYQAEWKDKVASYAIRFGVDAEKVRTFINSDVFGKINNVFASIPILKGFKIPYMATGGVVNGATLSVIGENGAEAVVPLENNTQWLGKMANMLATEMAYKEYTPPSYGSTQYTGNTSYSASTDSARYNEQAVQEQNALLREEIRLLQQIANKNVSISSRDVFDATRNESENYYNRTGNSPFLF